MIKSKYELIKYNFQRIKHHFKMSYALADDETKFWSAYPRQVGPSELYELKSHLIIDGDTYIETIIAGIPDAHLRGYPKGLNRHIMNELTDLNTKGCRVSISFSLVPVPVSEAADMLHEVVLQNLQNQITAKKQESIHGVETVPLDMVFDYEDHRENYKKFHDRKHNVFHSTLIIVLAAKNIDNLRTTKSLVMQNSKANLFLQNHRNGGKKRRSCWRSRSLDGNHTPLWKCFLRLQLYLRHFVHQTLRWMQKDNSMEWMQKQIRRLFSMNASFQASINFSSGLPDQERHLLC